MPPTHSSPDAVLPPDSASVWTYASVTVIDGQRELKPTHVAFDRIDFAAPPMLAGEQVEIVLVNGNDRQHHRAIILAHAPNATSIPIRLVPAA